MALCVRSRLRLLRPRGRHFALVWSFDRWSGSSRGSEGKIAHPNQIVGGSGQSEHPADSARAAMSRLTHHADRLHPAEDLLDPLARPETQLVTAMSGGAAIEGGGGLVAHMRGNSRCAKRVDKSDLVESSVRTQGDAPAFGKVSDHLQRGVSLGEAIGLGESGVEDQAVTVLHQNMPEVGQLRLCARGFL